MPPLPHRLVTASLCWFLLVSHSSCLTSSVAAHHLHSSNPFVGQQGILAHLPPALLVLLPTSFELGEVLSLTSLSSAAAASPPADLFLGVWASPPCSLWLSDVISLALHMGDVRQRSSHQPQALLPPPGEGQVMAAVMSPASLGKAIYLIRGCRCLGRRQLSHNLSLKSPVKDVGNFFFLLAS